MNITYLIGNGFDVNIGLKVAILTFISKHPIAFWGV